MDIDKRTATEKIQGEKPPSPSTLDHGISLTKLSTEATWHEYQQDEHIYSQGAAANAVFYILSGKAKLTVIHDGEEAVVSILSEGSFLGEGCLVGQLVRTATASVLLRSTIVRIEEQTMKTLLREEPEFAERFLAETLFRGIQMERDLVSHLINASEKDLPLLRLVQPNSKHEWKSIPASNDLSSKSLAETIGTTSSNVDYFLNRFRELGFIGSKGTEMLVHSSLISIVPNDNGVC